MQQQSPSIRLIVESPADELAITIDQGVITVDSDGGEVFSGELGAWPTLAEMAQAFTAIGGVTAVILPPYLPTDSTDLIIDQPLLTGNSPAWLEILGSRDPRPVIERIAQAIETRLKSITSSLESPGLKIDVQRPRRLAEISPRHLSIVLAAESADENEERPHQAYEEVHSFGVHLFIVPPDSSTSAVDTAINQFRADVTRALMTDPQWDGLAIDTFVRPPEYMPIIAGEFAGLTLPVDVLYRCDLVDPYSTLQPEPTP